MTDLPPVRLVNPTITSRGGAKMLPNLISGMVLNEVITMT